LGEHQHGQKNNSREEMKIIIRTLNGIKVSDFSILNQDDIKLNDLPAGMLIIEVMKENYLPIERKLVVVIKQ